jgi:hypothetical protein
MNGSAATPVSRRPAGGPAAATLLDVDRAYRDKAMAGALRTIAPRRFNPEAECHARVARP